MKALRKPSNLPSIAARQRTVAAVQRVERPMTRKTVGAEPTERTVGVYPSGERYSLPPRADVLCPGGCGFIMCGKRGPCAPQAQGEQHSPAKTRDHSWARVGMRVRVRLDAAVASPNLYGLYNVEGMVMGVYALSIDPYATVLIGGHLRSISLSCLEPTAPCHADALKVAP